MIFTILIGASIFSLIFRGVGGDELIDLVFGSLPGGPYTDSNFCPVVCVFTWLHLGFYRDMLCHSAAGCSTSSHDGF